MKCEDGRAVTAPYVGYHARARDPGEHRRQGRLEEGRVFARVALDIHQGEPNRAVPLKFDPPWSSPAMQRVPVRRVRYIYFERQRGPRGNADNFHRDMPG